PHVPQKDAYFIFTLYHLIASYESRLFMRDWAIENLFLSFNLSCFLSVYFNFGGQMVDKKNKKTPDLLDREL
ncbi:hypothetical protein NE688_20770, partial [Eubacterium callanderi]|uniref:hypothetical protein n=1 Tax=Eubacterium callanderi TaxID=53442 RepID=UPI002109C78F